MPSMRGRRRRFLAGDKELPLFLPAESIELSRTSRRGLRAPYFQKWIASRRRTRDNAIKNNWTLDQYRQHIKNQYLVEGFMKADTLGRQRVDVWAMLRFRAETAVRRGDEFESPWRDKIRRSVTRKREGKKSSRRQFINNWIADLDKNIVKWKKFGPSGEQRVADLERQKANLKKALGNVEG